MKTYKAIINNLAEINQEWAIKFLEEYMRGYRARLHYVFTQEWSFLSSIINDITWVETRQGSIYWRDIHMLVSGSKYNDLRYSPQKTITVNGEKRCVVTEVGGKVIYEMGHTEMKKGNKLAKILKP